MTKTIRVYYSFARSGGTLLNKILGTNPNLFVLSEINPAGSYLSIEKQISEWCDFWPQNVSLDKTADYLEKIDLIQNVCEKQSKTLVIRDWPTVNFFPWTYVPNEPSQILENEVYLQLGYSEVKEVVLTRKVENVFHSFMSNFVQATHFDETLFANLYLNYAKAVSTKKIFHLEDLQQNPDIIAPQICEHLHVPFTNDMIEDFAGFNKCTGNNTLRKQTESAKVSSIIKQRENSPSEPAWKNKDTAMLFRQANQLLQYEE